MTTQNQKTPIFTSDWSWQVRHVWPLHVLPNLDHTKAIHWLEIGSFEGRSTLWTIENMLQHPDSTITCVDPFDIWPMHEDQPNFNYETTFDHNTAEFASLIKHKGKSSSVLPTLKPNSFHGCYIDGSHDKADVLEDAHLIWNLMKPNAIIVFDDYGWGKGDGVKLAVSELLIEWGPKVEILHIDYQAVLKISC